VIIEPRQERRHSTGRPLWQKRQARRIVSATHLTRQEKTGEDDPRFARISAKGTEKFPQVASAVRPLA